MRLPPQTPPTLLRGETVSVEQLLLSGPDCATQLTGRWGGKSQTKPLSQQPMGVQEGEGGSPHWMLPGQPPLNECVRGMGPDFSYITGWRAGVRLWRGSEQRKGFFQLHFIYLYPAVVLRWLAGIFPNDTLKYVICSAQKSLFRQIFFQVMITRIMPLSYLFCFATMHDAFLPPRTVTHVIGWLWVVYERTFRKQQFSEELWRPVKAFAALQVS